MTVRPASANHVTGASREFWDHHHTIVEDPFFWMALPSCRSAINRRISGDAGRWPLEEFARVVGHRQFQRGLSLGCGLGGLERAVRRLGLCEDITGVDFSSESLAIAKERAEHEGLTGIVYRLGDLNEIRLPRKTYDVVFIHQSLHHVTSVEKLLGRVARTLTPEGYLFLEEWTGPSNDEWTPQELAHAAALYQEIPREWRKFDTLAAPIVMGDPSENIRSSAILPAVRLYFDVAERPYGGHLVPILMCQLDPNCTRDPRFESYLTRWLSLEDEDLSRDPLRSYHTAMAGRAYRGLRGVWAQARGLARRIRLFAKYRWRAAKHRLGA